MNGMGYVSGFLCACMLITTVIFAYTGIHFGSLAQFLRGGCIGLIMTVGIFGLIGGMTALLMWWSS